MENGGKKSKFSLYLGKKISYLNMGEGQKYTILWEIYTPGVLISVPMASLKAGRPVIQNLERSSRSRSTSSNLVKTSFVYLSF